MDDKLMSTIDKISRLTQQNTEFDMELRKRLNVASANSALSDDERINQIYEYCIEKNHKTTSHRILCRLSFAICKGYSDWRFCPNGVFQKKG